MVIISQKDTNLWPFEKQREKKKVPWPNLWYQSYNYIIKEHCVSNCLTLINQSITEVGPLILILFDNLGDFDEKFPPWLACICLLYLVYQPEFWGCWQQHLFVLTVLGGWIVELYLLFLISAMKGSFIFHPCLPATENKIQTTVTRHL